jgi:hypothetical protein
MLAPLLCLLRAVIRVKCVAIVFRNNNATTNANLFQFVTVCVHCSCSDWMNFVVPKWRIGAAATTHYLLPF